MSLADNLRKEHVTNNTLTLAQSLRNESSKAQRTSIERAKTYDRYALAKSEQESKALQKTELPTFSQVEKEFGKQKHVGLNVSKLSRKSTGNLTADYVQSKLSDSGLKSAEREATDAYEKVKNRPWYVPKPIAVMIENSKLSKDAKVLFANKNQDAQAKSAGGVYANSLVDSAVIGLKPTLQRAQAKAAGDVGKEFLKQQADAKANHPVADTMGTISGYLAPGSVAEKGAAKVLAPAFTKIGSKIAQKAITGATTAGGMELTEGLIRGESPEQIAKRTAIGIGVGAAGDVAFYGLGKGVETILSKLKTGKALTQAEHVLITEEVKKTPEILSLPEVKQYLQITGPTLKDRYVITPDVIEALPPKPTIDDIKALKIKPSKNVGSTGFEMYTLDDLEDMIKIVESDKKQMIDDQLKWLKSTHGKGVEQGSLFVDDLGNVVGRQGRISKNELWYQKWAKENNYRKINNNDLREIAEKQLKEGYESLSGDIPADGIFKRYDDTLKLLLQEKNSNNRFNNSLSKASQYLEAKRNQFYNVPEQYRKEIPKLVPRTTVTPPKFESKYAKESLNLLEPPQIKTLKNNNVSVLPTPSNKAVMDSPKTKQSFKQTLSDMYTKTVDKNNPINKKLSPVDGGKTSMLASNTSNANGTIDYILQDALVDRQGKKIGQSLKEVAERIPKGKEKDFWEYMSQRHNIDRAREGKNVIANYTPEMSEKAVKQIEAANPTWKAAGDNITNWIDSFMREWGVSAGTVDREVYDQLRNTYKSYFPTQREFSQLEKSIPGDVRKQFVDSSSPIKKATGSERDIHNPLSNIMNLVNRTVKTARHNEVGQSLLNSVRNQPEKLKAFAEIVSEPKNVDNVVTVLENGKPVYLQINSKELLDSLKGLPKTVNNAQAMRKVSNVYKSLITQKNPIFAVRNMARDIPTAYVYGSEANPVKFTGDLLKAGKDIVTGSESLQRYKALGGGGANFLAGNADKAAKTLLKKPNLLQKAGSSIETFNNLTETAPRLAEFNRVFEKTGDVQKALAAANDVTVNFARGGNVTKSLDPFVPYLNASVQGLDKFFRQVKNKPLQTLVKSGIAITTPEVALYLVNKDDPNYQALGNRTKDTYFLIPKGDGTFTKIPKSRELGVLFGSLFQRIARASEGDKKAFKGFGNALATGFAPTNPVENNIFAPVAINIPKNKDFAGRAIVPMGMQMDKRSKYLQYDEKTTEIAKAIGKLSHDVTGGEGLSPKQIDYIIKSYTGVIGQLGIPAATEGGNPGKAITSQFVADPLYSNQTIQDFYDNYTKVQKKAADNNLINKLPSKLTTPEEALEGKFRKASSQISDLNKQIREAQGDETKIKELRKQIVIIAKEANELLKQ